MANIGKLLNKPPDRRTFRTGGKFILPNTLFGVECEMENAAKALPPTIGHDFWSVHNDGSLRNHGIEYVFAHPLFGEDAEEALKWLVSNATAYKYKTSIRTGLHVHVDVRDLDIEQFRSLCEVYALVEKLIFNWVGEAREESIYCVPWYYADSAVDQCHRIAEGFVRDAKLSQRSEQEGNTGKQYAEVFERYAGLNLNSLHRFGSVEFRHMPMTFDLERIHTWINMLLALKRYALTRASALKDATRMGGADFCRRLWEEGPFFRLYVENKWSFGQGKTSATDLRRKLTADTLSGTSSAMAKYRKVIGQGPHPSVKQFLADQTIKSKEKPKTKNPAALEDF